MSQPFGIAGVQLEVVPWDAAATVTKMDDAVTQIRRNFPWINMVLFHELAVPGLVQLVSTADVDTWKKDAQPIPGPLTDRLSEIAKRNLVWLIPGSMYEVDGDDIYNTSPVISPDGEIVTRYRKMFPWLPYEKGVTAGDEFVVFDVPDVGRFGVSICYDMWFPETTRTLAWMGAEVILHPTLTDTIDREVELSMARASAACNQCYFIDVNSTGRLGNGQSIFVGPGGEVLHQCGTGREVVPLELDLELVRRYRRRGGMGLGQPLKSFRDSSVRFPPYIEGHDRSETLGDLGGLVVPQRGSDQN